MHRVAEATGVDPAAIEPSETPKAKLCPFAGVDQQASGDDRVHRVRQPVMSAIETARFVGMGHVRWHRRKAICFQTSSKRIFAGFFLYSPAALRLAVASTETEVAGKASDRSRRARHRSAPASNRIPTKNIRRPIQRIERCSERRHAVLGDRAAGPALGAMQKPLEIGVDVA